MKKGAKVRILFGGYDGYFGLILEEHTPTFNNPYTVKVLPLGPEILLFSNEMEEC